MLMLPKLCHLDNHNDLRGHNKSLYNMSIFIYCVVHMTYIPYLGTFFSHGTPVWPWPVIFIRAQAKAYSHLPFRIAL